MDALIENLETGVDQVRASLASGKEEAFFPTVTLVTARAIEVSLLMGHAATGNEMLEVIEGVGFKRGRRNRVPDFIIVAAESVSADGAEKIMISGCSKESGLAIGYLGIDRSAEGKIRASSWSGAVAVPSGQAESVPAFRAMRGAITKSQAPWWRFWR